MRLPGQSTLPNDPARPSVHSVDIRGRYPTRQVIVHHCAAAASIFCCSISCSDPMANPFRNAGSAEHSTLCTPTRLSESSENCSRAGLAESKSQSGNGKVTQSLSVLSTRDWIPGVFVHSALLLIGVQVPVPLGPVQACGTISRTARGALFTAIPERDRTKVSAIDAEKNIVMKERVGKKGEGRREWGALQRTMPLYGWSVKFGHMGA
ncbi:hypothetical protein DFH09DRAFT_1164501 [Mycena vulgaris]|nr:hypothetical protein DFH09DRAFT_1164501 [Mycena vulgaris]